MVQIRDLTKFMKGELKGDAANVVIRHLIAQGINKVELRDEIYCQLVRQTNCNPNVEWCLRVWSVFCLCSVSFGPSHTLHKFIVSYVQHNCDHSEHRVANYAKWCLSHVRRTRSHVRRMPPSRAEITAVRNLQPMVCRINFMDGITKAISLEPYEIVVDVLRKVQQKIDLQNLHGWALYEHIPEHERHIREHEYLADVLSDWEEKQRSMAMSTGSPKRCSPKIPTTDYGRVVCCKRIFCPIREIPEDPAEYHLLYAQAVHHNVVLDDYSVPQSVALHLAGLQAQVLHEEYEDDKLARYADVDEFLPQRIMNCEGNELIDWRIEIAAAHKKYGCDKTKTEAQYRYLMLVSQFPLYGCIRFFAHYKGIWQFGAEFIIALSHSSIRLISIQEKTIVVEHKYTDLEMLHLDFERSCLTIMLRSRSQGKQKCYLFECFEVEDLATVLETYSPNLTTWSPDSLQQKCRKKWMKEEGDCLRISDDILKCRKWLKESDILQRRQDSGFGLFKTALKKLSGRACGPDRGGGGAIDADDPHDARGAFWSFSRVPFKHSLLAYDSHEMEDVAIRMFNSTLVYAGIESAAVLEEGDMAAVVQTLITKCMESDDLCNEFYLQLIKQTTECPAENNSAVVKYWHLLLCTCCIMLPPNNLILIYLNLHLKRQSLMCYNEEGQFAQFCTKCLERTYETKGRKFPPSYKEIGCVTKRQTMDLRVHLPDGQQMVVQCDSSTTAEEVMPQLKARIGMRVDATGFGLYESTGVAADTETYVAPCEKIADSLYKWEKWSQVNTSPSNRDMRFIFKKRLFVDPYVNLMDPVEVDLLYHQSVTDLFEGKIPLTKDDTIHLCALRAQSEFGDYGLASDTDYMQVLLEYLALLLSVMRILPRHLRDLIDVLDIALDHRNVSGMAPMAANIAFIEVLKAWPLYGATFFDVTQSYADSLPKFIWLAVSQLGIHLMEQRGQDIYSTFAHKEVKKCTPTVKSLTITLYSIGGNGRNIKLLFNTTQGSQIQQLVYDYQEVVIQKSVDDDTPSPASDTHIEDDFLENNDDSDEHL